MSRIAHVITVRLGLAEIKDMILQQGKSLALTDSRRCRIKEAGENDFLFTERDLTHTRSFRVRIREHQIWAPDGIEVFFYLLLSAKAVPFSVSIKKFSNAAEAQAEFELCSACRKQSAFQQGQRFDICMSCAEKEEEDLREKLTQALSPGLLILFKQYLKAEEMRDSMVILVD